MRDDADMPAHAKGQPNLQLRVVGILWFMTGFVLGIDSAWELGTMSHSSSASGSVLLVSAFSVLAMAAGIMLSRMPRLGHILTFSTSTLTILYAMSWLFMGGVEDAGSYWPAISFMAALSIYSFFVCSLAYTRRHMVNTWPRPDSHFTAP